MDTWLAGSVIYGTFNTHKADGTPITLAGSPALSVYKNNGTTEDLGDITLNVNFDGVTGLHQFTIDTSIDSTFYATGNTYFVTIDAGTVDSISAVGAVVYAFRMGLVPADMRAILGTALTETTGYLAAGFKKLFNVATPVFTAASVDQTGDAYAKTVTILADTAELQTDWVNGGRLDLIVDAINAKTTNIPASPATAGVLSTVEGKVDSVLEDTAMLQTDLVNGGRLDLLVDAIIAKTNLIPASPAAVGSKMDIVDAPSSTGKAALASANADQVWDEAMSGHVVAGSAAALLALAHSIAAGGQKIENNQLICYAADNITEVARFNLFDANGDPSMASVYLRARV